MLNHRREMKMTANPRERVQVKAVSMYPDHWAIVHEFAQNQGYGSTSAALRRIVDEWKQARSTRPQLPEGGERSQTDLGAP